jgi:hypothetical protein
VLGFEPKGLSMRALRRNVDWVAIPFAGLAAGTAHLLVNLILTPLMLDVQPMLPIRYMGSLLLGERALVEPGIVPLLAGILVHYVLSILFTLVISIVVHRWGLLVGIVGGAVLGLAIYAINYYTMTLFFDWMFAINSPVQVIAHLVFGAVAGGVYETYDHFDLPLRQEIPNV